MVRKSMQEHEKGDGNSLPWSHRRWRFIFWSDSDDKKSSAIYEETEYLKQKEEEWLERQYKNMKMDIHVLSNEAVEHENLFFDPNGED